MVFGALFFIGAAANNTIEMREITLKNDRSTKMTILFLVANLLALTPGFGQDLLLYPKRIVFEGTQNRVQTVNLTNNGADTATYRISFVQTRMTEEGMIENIDNPEEGQRFADPYLRVFPKTVSIAPGKSQLVKLQLTKTSELMPGEYRSHLYFRTEPKSKPLKANKEVKSEVSGINIEITPVYGYAISSIIRIGEPTTEVQINELVLDTSAGSGPVLHMNFLRSGNMSTYGDIRIYHISPSGKESEIGKTKGFSIYAPGHLRKTSIELQPEGVDLSSGSLHITYASSGTGKNVYAQTSLAL